MYTLFAILARATLRLGLYILSAYVIKAFVELVRVVGAAIKGTLGGWIVSFGQRVRS